MDPYNRRKAAGGRTITVRLNAEDGALLDRMKAEQGISLEAAMRNGMWFWARFGLQMADLPHAERFAR